MNKKQQSALSQAHQNSVNPPVTIYTDIQKALMETGAFSNLKIESFGDFTRMTCHFPEQGSVPKKLIVQISACGADVTVRHPLDPGQDTARACHQIDTKGLSSQEVVDRVVSSIEKMGGLTLRKNTGGPVLSVVK